MKTAYILNTCQGWVCCADGSQCCVIVLNCHSTMQTVKSGFRCSTRSGISGSIHYVGFYNSTRYLKSRKDVSNLIPTSALALCSRLVGWVMGGGVGGGDSTLVVYPALCDLIMRKLQTLRSLSLKYCSVLFVMQINSLMLSLKAGEQPAGVISQGCIRVDVFASCSTSTHGSWFQY